MTLGVIPVQARLLRFLLHSSGHWLCLLLRVGGMKLFGVGEEAAEESQLMFAGVTSTVFLLHQ